MHKSEDLVVGFPKFESCVTGFPILDGCMIVKMRSSESVSDSDVDCDSANEMPGRANVKLPEFWAKELALWLVTAEGQFATKGITVEATKLAHVMASLPVEVATWMKDELLSPDTAAHTRL